MELWGAIRTYRKSAGGSNAASSEERIGAGSGGDEDGEGDEEVNGVNRTKWGHTGVPNKIPPIFKYVSQ